MDVDLLRTFLEVHRTRHFGRAAENLFLSQSAVSARIRLLEETVGVALFTRSRHNIQLTAAGQRLLRYAESIVTTWNQARQAIALGAEDSPAVVAGSVPGLADLLLQPWLRTLHRLLPEAVLHAEVHGPDALLRRLQDRTLDLAFLFEPPSAAELLVEELGGLRLILVAAREGLDAAEALNSDYVLVDWGTSFAIQHARHFPDAPVPRMRANLARLALNYVLEEGGAAYLAEPTVRGLLAERRLFAVAGAPVIDRAAYAVYAARSDKRGEIERMLAALPRPGG